MKESQLLSGRAVVLFFGGKRSALHAYRTGLARGELIDLEVPLPRV